MVIIVKINNLPLGAFKADGGFIGKYQKLIRETVVPYQYAVLNDEIEGAEKSHVIKNFINAAAALSGEENHGVFYGMVFQDSDAFKWLEAAAYCLSNVYSDNLRKTCDSLIKLIESAQDEDGYLNTYYTVKDRDKRWTNLLEGHELYCSGHFIEAACAFYEATGDGALLEAAKKNADCIYDVFITNGHEGYPGHPEIELALLRLWEETGEEKYLSLARHFVDKRGVDPHFFENERKKRDWTVWNGDGRNREYQQSHMPVRLQKDAVGHSVRAVYLYTAMAALAKADGDSELFEACRALWKSITKKRMYLTGSIGSTCHGEAFTVDYDLPSDTAYAETCASVGLCFFASQLLCNEVKGDYADVMERAFYNSVLAGMSLDGKSFFYVNPLESVPGISGEAVTHRHALTRRPTWYTCACCPPNVARFVTSLGKFAYGENNSTAFCHLYCQGEAVFKNGVRLRCQTQYPFEGRVTFKFIKGGKFALRIPSYSESFSLTLCGEKCLPEMKDGYAYIEVKDGDELQLELDFDVKIINPSVKIPELSGKAALMRGPLVYCFEGEDNGGEVLSLRLKKKSTAAVKRSTDAVLKGAPVIEVEAYKVIDADGELYTLKEPGLMPFKATAVPYFMWANRGEGEMRVWLPCR